MLGLIGTANKSLQNELMTAREWQHAVFFRDRWTPNDKLTLDLGLRWEYYPIMHRADGRGIDASIRRTLKVLVAGLGGNDQNNGMKPASTTSRRGWARSTASTTRRSSAAATASPTTRNRGRVRCAAITTTRSPSRRRTRTPSSSPPYAPLAQGIPLLVGPDASSGTRAAR